jgi:leucyl aminopeptidase
MPIAFSTARNAPRSADVVGIGVFTDGPVPRSLGTNRAALGALGFEGKLGQTALVPAPMGPLLVAIGLGDRSKVDAAALRTAAAALARASSKRTYLATAIADVDGVDARSAAQAVAEGVVLGSYKYAALKAEPGASKLEQVTLTTSAATMAATDGGAQRGATIAGAVCLARDLANTPPSHLTARDLAERATTVAAASGLDVTVYDEHALADMGCGGLLGVNRGSTEPPRLIKLHYTPRAASRGHVGLIGKGVMYDSGGISLKPSDGMHAMMKMDMSGAAVVLATMSVLKALRVKTEVTAYLCCTDNMPSGSAMKLGDVLKIRNGKTVEILNTDAEGRLVMADGLSLAVEDGVEAMCDIATLTGAALAALGNRIAAVLANNDAWADQVLGAAGRADEKLWRLPLHGEYRKLLDSQVADLKNVGGPYAGAITAGLFLKEFVGDVPWAHLDIAGTMNVDTDEGWLSKGATAYGVRTFVELLERYERPKADGARR